MTTLEELVLFTRIPKDEFEYWSTLIESGHGYSRMAIPQRRRGPREVIAPSIGLDRLLKQLSDGLAVALNYAPPEHVHGFIKGRSIHTNAWEHLNKDVVLRVDLADFFGSIDTARIETALQRDGFDPDAAEAVAKVTTVDGTLPLGFSTSPVLSNIVFHETDAALAEIAREANATFTRYADDLVFSGSQEAIHDGLFDLVRVRLERFGWRVNPKKTRFMRRGRSQFVTGLYVGDPEHPRIPRKMKRMVEREVYFAARYGLKNARKRSPTPMSPERLDGWVRFIQSVEPSGDRLAEVWHEIGWTRARSDAGRYQLLEMLEHLGLPYGPVHEHRTTD